jgi:hypothetical protein
MKLQNSALLETISLNERGGQSMSALPPKADIGTQSRDVRFVPKADIGALFDYLVRDGEQA